VIGSIWREKFEEMIVENAVLQVKLASLEKQMSCSLNKVQNSVVELNTELTRLKCCIDYHNDAGTVAGDVHSALTNDNITSMDMIS